MKRKKFIALLCVAATSASLVTPVMAEENLAVEATQETTVEQEAPEQEITADEAASEEDAAEDEGSSTEEADDLSSTLEESTTEEAESELTDETNTADTYAEKKNGLYEENGNTYYYEDGKMVTHEIVEFENEDGSTYAYYFGYDGIMLKNAYNYPVYWPTSPTEAHGGGIAADENGYLCTGWHLEAGDWRYYSKEDYFLCKSVIIKENGKQYYLNNDGVMVTNTTVIVENVVYIADANGILSVKDMGGKTEWVESNGNWYLYADGKLITNRFYEDNGKTYYFDENGCMMTGVFWDNTGKEYMAEPSGKVIINPSEGWNKSSETDTWYYFDYNGEDLEPVRGEMITVNGKKYYIGWDGCMVTGSFWYYNEDEGDLQGHYYFANSDGEIQSKASWYQDKEGIWFYVKDDGTLATDGIYQINGKHYKFDWNGELETGTIWMGEKKYMTDRDGALLYSEGWNALDGVWYYVKDDHSIVTNEFKEINGNLYYFDYDGSMQTGEFWGSSAEVSHPVRYYANADGAIIRNSWYQIDFDWYYATDKGWAVTDKWLNGAGGVWYYMNNQGAMVRGAYSIDDVVNFFDDNGVWTEDTAAKHDGWSYSDGRWFYYKEGKAYTGWVDNKYWVENGELCTNEVIKDADGREYYVNYAGIYQTGWIKMVGGYYYPGQWTYADASGAIVSDGWQEIGGKYYYFTDGVMNEYEVLKTEDYGVCTFASDGHWTGYAAKNSWIKTSDGYFYYVKDDGSLAKGEENIEGRIYYFNDSDYAVMYANMRVWDYNLKAYIWVNANGEKDMSNGWKYDGYNWYYVENGEFKNGWLLYGGDWYYLNDAMCKGIQSVEYNGSYEYAFFDDNGVYHKLTDGWKSINNNGYTTWYYVKNGKPAEGYVDGYYFYGNGQMETGSHYSNSGKIYYYDANGHLLKGTGWYYDSAESAWHYIYADGTMATGERTINGKTYWFTFYGDWVK